MIIKYIACLSSVIWRFLIYQHNETKLLNRSIVLAHTDSRVSLGLWRTRYIPFGLKLIIIELIKKVEKRLERIVSKHSLRWLSFSTPDCTTSVWHLDKICYMIRFLGISIPSGGIIINIDFFPLELVSFLINLSEHHMNILKEVVY